ncbi:cysteine desulfurase/selenocysteine lyase [Deinobacterium chartae]|uniref:cysteine desulfurase n=1 Tax=Deinobacterium chartae TaxID=521158 RepID=A0A841I2D3_9DEIO|nr:SufS family cysteine desulfurase [Deinobacterium chartae]MBB6099981.1 cysteine desulfurase/selenocysteine lyase [Deinobacterium chartae]
MQGQARTLEAVRDDFPLIREWGGVYLDSAATSQKPESVIAALSEHYRTRNANVHRGAYRLSSEATAAYEGARSSVARLLGVEASESLIFTRGTTESINLVAHAWGLNHLEAGDEILVTELEHHSNLVPWHLVAGYRSARVVGVRLLPDGRLDLEDYRDKLGSGRVRMVALTHISNALGTVNPVAEMARMAHEVGAKVLVDGAQAVPHLPVNLSTLGADFYAFSGHKMLGPSGIGGLWGRPELLGALPPFMGGGEMIREVFVDHSSYAGLPHRFEAGTPAIEAAVALGVAAEYLMNLGPERIWQHDRALVSYALERISRIEGIESYGPVGEDRAGVLSFNLRGVHAHDVASMLDERGIMVRSGHHCAQPTWRRLGTVGSVRASFYLYNTPQDVDRLIAALEEVRDFFGEHGL